MRLGAPKSLHIRRSNDGRLIAVYERYVHVTEIEMTDLDKDLLKAVDKINALLKERASLYAENAALRTAAQAAVPMDADSPAVMSQFHDLMLTLPDAAGQLPTVPAASTAAPATVAPPPTSPNEVVLQ